MKDAYMKLLHKRSALLTLLAAVSTLSGCAHDKSVDAAKAYQRGDYTSAYQEYLQLAKAGDVKAQATVACMIQAGEGVSPDPARALPWYTKAAEQGDAKATDGIKRLTGADSGSAQAAPAASAARGVTGAPVAVKKPAVAVATAGSPARAAKPAPVATQAAVEPEQTMPELIFGDQKIAAKKRAAERGDVDAQVYLGWCYSAGKEVERDKSEAVKWYRMAAESGRLNAQTALGWIYFSGEAGTRDLGESAKWYIKAAAQGDVTARKMLRRIEMQTAGL
jgi:uncharacterized protein